MRDLFVFAGRFWLAAFHFMAAVYRRARMVLAGLHESASPYMGLCFRFSVFLSRCGGIIDLDRNLPRTEAGSLDRRNDCMAVVLLLDLGDDTVRLCHRRCGDRMESLVASEPDFPDHPDGHGEPSPTELPGMDNRAFARLFWRQGRDLFDHDRRQLHGVRAALQFYR